MRVQFVHCVSILAHRMSQASEILSFDPFYQLGKLSRMATTIELTISISSKSQKTNFLKRKPTASLEVQGMAVQLYQFSIVY